MRRPGREGGDSSFLARVKKLALYRIMRNRSHCRCMRTAAQPPTTPKRVRPYRGESRSAEHSESSRPKQVTFESQSASILHLGRTLSTTSCNRKAFSLEPGAGFRSFRTSRDLAPLR